MADKARMPSDTHLSSTGSALRNFKSRSKTCLILAALHDISSLPESQRATCHSHQFLVHLLRVENAARGKDNVIEDFLLATYRIR